MYAYIWRKLPFGLAGKLTGSIVLCTAIGVLLWYVAFPWATPLLPFDDVQVGSTSGQQNGPAQEDPNLVTTDNPGLGPDEVPYSTHSNEPEPSPSR
ncbi:MAG: hypothetical protein QOC94_2560 [Actinoplanes sp.]|jgi:hypothetical protein|nr:hypothetical protein [Actinoplanes sp.]